VNLSNSIWTELEKVSIQSVLKLNFDSIIRQIIRFFVETQGITAHLPLCEGRTIERLDLST
jgi:hypothetical protein